MTKQYFFDLKEESDHSKMGSEKQSSSGCHVSWGIAFILVLLSVLVAVVVGLIVHFAERDSYDRDITCTFPESLTAFFQKFQDGQATTTQHTQMIPSTPLTTSTASTPKDGYRLPLDVKPLEYDLELKPNIYNADPSTFKFEGIVKINILCAKATKVIVMNSKNLTIEQPRVTRLDGGQSLVVDKTEVNDELETFRIFLRESLEENKTYRVEMNFNGPLTDDLAGLYLSTYKRANETVYLATTQFESPDAREAFPCFDEPAFKANFTITLLRKPPKISLSNTRIVSTESRADGYVADKYETTPRMSTYLLAFIICDFVNISGRTNKSIQFGVWARPELSHLTHYALDTGMKIIDYYEDYFDFRFPLSKQDMIAIPDFAAGAMENWGLITYRESALLYEPNVTSESDRQYVTLVIAHELAHQWFGNLVTLAWWEDLWLNEGFAEFVEYIGMDLIESEWKMWEQFAYEAVQYVFASDQLVTSHPLYVPVETVEEMEQYFDSISYEKGASVIRMIRFCLGEETFKRGLQRYIKAHAYANANHTDLWNALSEQSRVDGKSLDVADIMNTWTLQMGFPVVKLSLNSDGKISATQKRFLINPDAKDPGIFHSPYGYKWEIPITFTSSKSPNFDVTDHNITWLHKDDAVISPSSPLPDRNDASGWIIGNIFQNGYYRVNYEEQNWKALASQMKKDYKVIPPVNRAQIIDDVWNLASAGDTSVSVAMETLEYLETEVDYVPWAAASAQLNMLMTQMAETGSFGALKRFIQDKTRPIFNKLGLDDTNAKALESYTRKTVVSLACGTGIKECIDEAVRLFQQWRQSPDKNPISPAVRQRVYCTAVNEGDESDWLFMLERFRQETVPTEKNLLMRSLACSSRMWILSTLLNMSLEGKDIRRDDATGVIAYVARNSIGSRLAWDFIRSNWNTIITDFSQSSSRLDSMMKSTIASFYSQFQLDEVRAFVNQSLALGKAEQILKQTLETMEYNFKWYSRSYPDIAKWLGNKGYGQFEGSQDKTTPEINVRLPTNLRPSHYDLTINPDMYGPDPAKFTFRGSVTLTFTCVVATSEIVLHIEELNVTNIRISYSSTSQQPRYLSQSVDTERQFLVIKLDRNMTSGQNYSVSMDFEGPLDKDLDGLYLSSYTDVNNETVYLATTQFEPVAARKAFPCMDEPAMKATFTITIIRHKNYTALSNMPVVHNVTYGNLIADTFAKTLPMSTYLVAFIVCNFGSKINYTLGHNVTYEVYARPSAVGQLDFSLDIGVNALDYYETYFNISFPLPKQAMIAIPDFSAGAMENWGLITYRETSLLIQPGTSSMGDKEGVAMTVAHELAHMWFGDLVSPLWWDDLWLNEGFARFMQYLAVDHLHPEWKEWDQFVTDTLHKAMAMDGLVTSHPLYVPVATPAQINEIFDSISYDKGASVIRMIRHAIGEDTFRRGLTAYLNNLSYKNANHNDLWNALNQQAVADNRGVKVGDVMDTWILQMNFPVVTITWENDIITLTQERFKSDRQASDVGKYVSPFGYTWDIPVTYTTSNDVTFNKINSDVIWLYRNETTKTVRTSANSGGQSWVLGNIKETGYYRVNYDSHNWHLLATQLQKNNTIIDPVNRAQIINDAWNLASGGYTDLNNSLAVVTYLDQENEYIPWQAAVSQLSYVNTMLSTTELYGPFKRFMANKTAGHFRRLTMNNANADMLESFLRSLIVAEACRADVEECVTESKRLFADWRNNTSNNQIAPELRSAVYCTAIRLGSVQDWEFLYERYLHEENVNEKKRQLYQLACSNEIWILNKLISRSMNSGDIRAQDSTSVLSQVALNPIGTSLVWRYVRESWDVLLDRYGEDPFALKNLVSALSGMFNTPTQLEEIQVFVSTHPDLGAATRAFQSAMETTRNNIRWMEKNYEILKTWLTDLGFNA